VKAQYRLPELRSPLDLTAVRWIFIADGEQAPSYITVGEGDARTQLPRESRYGRWLYSAPCDWGDDPEGSTANLTIELPGAERFSIRPVARSSEVALNGNWGTPSFVGDRLPTARTVEEGRFSSNWSLSGGGGTAFWGGFSEQVSPAQVGVRLLDPISRYQVVTRTVKYAFLVIVLTFATFFLFEVMSGLHIHLVQYLLVGLALVMFYLLLLSQTEHMSFEAAYAIASGAVVALVTVYTRAMLSTARNAVLCGAGLAGVYGVLYPILREEQYALLTGSWALFLLLAAVMWVTRKVDWSAVGRARTA
ncbi:MAG: cell envelope integrity protein CreD, partial [Myxococcota bacterium]